jgi:hypothetical protein
MRDCVIDLGYHYAVEKTEVGVEHYNSHPVVIRGNQHSLMSLRQCDKSVKGNEMTASFHRPRFAH